MNIKALVAEVIGTFWLVFASLGAAKYAAIVMGGEQNIGIGLLGVSLAFGLTIVTMAYAIGHISGCHLNPAVTLGLVAGGRFDAKNAPGYIGAQVLGAILGAGLLLLIGSSAASAGALDSFDIIGTSNGYGVAHPAGEPSFYGLVPAFIAEFVLTAVFLFVIMGSTSKNAPVGFAPLAIGLCLTLIHLISIPITNTSVNPARSIGTAIFSASAGWPMAELWLFIVAPILGGIVGGIFYRWINSD